MKRAIPLLLSAACMGRVQAPEKPTRPDPVAAIRAACAGRDPGPAPTRRLTRFEYDNTIRDLLGDASAPGKQLPPDEAALGFDNNAEARSVTEILADGYMKVAEQVARRAVEHLDTLVPCPPSLGCAESFVRTFGKRAWRRPLDARERTRMLRVFERGEDFATGIRLVVQTFLQAPQFLYRIERGTPVGTRVRLTPYEIATRLSYLLWASMPDEALLVAAADGKIETQEQIASQARRMLADPKALAQIKHFHDQWLDLDRIDEIHKDKKVVKGYKPELRELFRGETHAFLEQVMVRGDGSLTAMLTAPYSFMNAGLAKYHGLTGPAGEVFERVNLDPTQRAGLLTQAGLLSVLAKNNQTSPVERGKFVRERLLCTTPPPPPPNAEVKPPEPDPRLTTRERFAEHVEDVGCAKCHRMMDPIGFGFENYDAIGRWQAQENGKPIDNAGEVVDSDVAGEFHGAVELAHKLAQSRDVRSCVVKNWFRYGFGRSEEPADSCTMEALGKSFEGSGLSVRELLVALTQTEAFLWRRAR